MFTYARFLSLFTGKTSPPPPWKEGFGEFYAETSRRYLNHTVLSLRHVDTTLCVALLSFVDVFFGYFIVRLDRKSRPRLRQLAASWPRHGGLNRLYSLKYNRLIAGSWRVTGRLEGIPLLLPKARNIFVVTIYFVRPSQMVVHL